ncbi:hypothetical protein MTR62_18420 [Novosphingobium sp. 1949]|uniref:Uncharacterized protein n=1 Tax=Novosphingobium organovorum TaxID=2930092 RepID=A0ABT0BHV3_9SPHN|nr:hypothetical protein [Novosphingobium organovorum]MCJ2184648.1 hypothetical protein [Novosphingobium organovorum]
MVDILALALAHGLIALAVWRLLARPDLDDDALAADAPAKGGPPPSASSGKTGKGRRAARQRGVMIVPGAAHEEGTGHAAGPEDGSGHA